MNSDEWEKCLHSVAPKHWDTYMKFRGQIPESFRKYHLPVIQLHKNTSKEAVCLVFEKVNTGGVQLTVFELITASYAAELQDRLRILSGFYGIVRPLDLIAPYRLEMGTKLSVAGKATLYEFWEEKLI